MVLYWKKAAPLSFDSVLRKAYLMHRYLQEDWSYVLTDIRTDRWRFL